LEDNEERADRCRVPTKQPRGCAASDRGDAILLSVGEDHHVCGSDREPPRGDVREIHNDHLSDGPSFDVCDRTHRVNHEADRATRLGGALK
jgi:hypothetical protein